MRKRRPVFDALESRRLCDGTGYPDLPEDVFAPPPPYPPPPADGRDISAPLDSLPLIPPVPTIPPGISYPTAPDRPNYNIPIDTEPVRTEPLV